MWLIFVEKCRSKTVSGETLRIEKFVTGQSGGDNDDDDDDEDGDFLTAISVVMSRDI